MRLTRHVTQPLDDAVSFKNVLDRRADLYLKRIYVLVGEAYKPVVALASVVKGMEVWVENLDLGSAAETRETNLLESVRNIKLLTICLAEASDDMLKSFSRIMLNSVIGRRALWLRLWVAGTVSKQTWCKTLLESQSLFSNKLDVAIAKATGRKSVFFPQDRSLLAKCPFQVRGVMSNILGCL